MPYKIGALYIGRKEPSPLAQLLGGFGSGFSEGVHRTIQQKQEEELRREALKQQLVSNTSPEFLATDRGLAIMEALGINPDDPDIAKIREAGRESLGYDLSPFSGVLGMDKEKGFSRTGGTAINVPKANLEQIGEERKSIPYQAVESAQTQRELQKEVIKGRTKNSLDLELYKAKTDIEQKNKQENIRLQNEIDKEFYKTKKDIDKLYERTPEEEVAWNVRRVEAAKSEVDRMNEEEGYERYTVGENGNIVAVDYSDIQATKIANEKTLFGAFTDYLARREKYEDTKIEIAKEVNDLLRGKTSDISIVIDKASSWGVDLKKDPDSYSPVTLAKELIKTFNEDVRKSYNENLVANRKAIERLRNTMGVKEEVFPGAFKPIGLLKTSLKELNKKDKEKEREESTPNIPRPSSAPSLSKPKTKEILERKGETDTEEYKIAEDIFMMYYLNQDGSWAYNEDISDKDWEAIRARGEFPDINYIKVSQLLKEMKEDAENRIKKNKKIRFAGPYEELR